MAAIEVDTLFKAYGAVDALRGVSFAVEEGEVFALLGPNGAGKTTTLEILEGHRRRSGGRVSVLGVDPQTASRALHERIGIVLQSAGVDGDLSVREVVALYRGFYPRGLAVAELLALVGLGAKHRARVKTLSGGQRRRLDLALALVGDPELLFLDEPTVGLDPGARRDTWQLVERLRDLGRTIVLTSHYMDEVARLADHAVVLAGGKIVAEGSPDSLGGRAPRQTLIRFRLPISHHADELPAALPRARESGNGQLVITTTQPTRVLARLCGWAAERSLELRALEVVRPSLEDAYLQLTDPDANGGA